GVQAAAQRRRLRGGRVGRAGRADRGAGTRRGRGHRVVRPPGRAVERHPGPVRRAPRRLRVGRRGAQGVPRADRGGPERAGPDVRPDAATGLWAAPGPCYTSGMSAEAAALLRAIRDCPDDDLPRLALADWLEEAGDPDRAAFLRTQVELSRLPDDDPRRPGLEDREHELLAGHEEHWLAAAVGDPGDA